MTEFAKRARDQRAIAFGERKRDLQGENPRTGQKVPRNHRVTLHALLSWKKEVG